VSFSRVSILKMHNSIHRKRTRSYQRGWNGIENQEL